MRKTATCTHCCAWDTSVCTITSVVCDNPSASLPSCDCRKYTTSSLDPLPSSSKLTQQPLLDRRRQTADRKEPTTCTCNALFALPICRITSQIKNSERPICPSQMQPSQARAELPCSFPSGETKRQHPQRIPVMDHTKNTVWIHSLTPCNGQTRFDLKAGSMGLWYLP